MHISTLRKQAASDIIDYPFLMAALNAYDRPREKVSSWLKSRDLIRIKKGLYVFGKETARNPYSLNQLANLIYGPSAISLLYALSYYGFIPEKVQTVTSITAKRNKLFETPAGTFTYRHLHPKKYAIGVTWITTDANESFFIATPEKAICDHLTLIDKTITLNTVDDVEAYLFHDMRMDENVIDELKPNALLEIASTYQDQRLNVLHQFIKSRK